LRLLSLSSFLGSSLSERRTEKSVITSFLKNSIKSSGKSSNALFVAGPPGCGKTATVLNVIDNLFSLRSSGSLPSFSFLVINAMSLRTPYDAYTSLWRSVSGKVCSPVEASAGLDKWFGRKEGEKNVMVLLLDEMDYLVTRKQTVLYDLFDWPGRVTVNKLCIIGIANTINLPERLLPRVQSRLGLLRVTFQAYNVEQMKSILKTRLREVECFEDGAVEFAARKTVGLSGDCRRAFLVCAEAVKGVIDRVRAEKELGKEDISYTVKVRDVVNAVRGMTDVPQLQSLRCCSDFDALVVVSAASLLSSTGREEGGIGVEELRQKMSAVAAALGDSAFLPIPSFPELLQILNRLNDCRMIILETPKNQSMRLAAAGTSGVWPLVFLNVDVYDVLDVLVQTKHRKLAEKNLRRI